MHKEHECMCAPARRPGGEGERRTRDHAARQTSSHAMAARTLASSQRLYESYSAPRNELPASVSLPKVDSGDAWAAEDVDGGERRNTSPRLPVPAALGGRSASSSSSARSSSRIAGAADERGRQVPPSAYRAPRLCRSETSAIHDNANGG